MKIAPNEKVCLLLDKIILDAPKPVNENSYDKKTFLETFPNTTSDLPHGTNNDFLLICKPSNIYLSAAAKIVCAKASTNAVIYPARGCMGWHTNSDLEGTRVYYTKTDGEAIFSYIKDGVRIDDYDNVGTWTCRQFKVLKSDPLWHSIWTEKHRYAFGFMI